MGDKSMRDRLNNINFDSISKTLEVAQKFDLAKQQGEETRSHFEESLNALDQANREKENRKNSWRRILLIFVKSLRNSKHL